MRNAPIVWFLAAAEDEPRLVPLTARLAERGFTIVVGPPLVTFSTPPLLTCVAVTPASNRAPAVRDQAQRALADGLRLAPLILSSRHDLPAYLAQMQWVDASGPFERGWLDLLATLDRAGITRFPLAPGWFDWEVALARAYRGLLPPDWRAYRISPAYYSRRARNTLLQLLLMPVLLVGLGAYPLSQLTTLWRLRGSFVAADALAVLAVWGAIILVVITRQAWTTAHDYGSGMARRADRSEICILSPDGFGLRAQQGDIVCQFTDLLAIEQVPDPPRAARKPDLDPERGIRSLGTVYGALRVTRRDGATETIALGDRFPDRALIVRQISARFIARRQHMAGADNISSQFTAAPIFISHARKDRIVVDRIDETLRLAGYQTWVDRSMLAGGQEWSHELQRAIEACAALVVMVSPNALASSVVREEYEMALRLGKPVLAVALRPTPEAPEALRVRLCARFVHGAGEGAWQRGWAPLLVALRQVGAPLVDPGAFNAHRALAETLAGTPEPDWHVYRTAPVLRNPTIWTFIVIATLPVAAVIAALTLGAPGWLLVILICVACLVVVACVVEAWPNLAYPWRLTLTPAGAAVLRGVALDSYAWSDYRSARRARLRDPSQAFVGSVLLTMRDTEREQRIVSLAQFVPHREIALATLTAFEVYQAARAIHRSQA